MRFTKTMKKVVVTAVLLSMTLSGFTGLTVSAQPELSTTTTPTGQSGQTGQSELTLTPPPIESTEQPKLPTTLPTEQPTIIEEEGIFLGDKKLQDGDEVSLDDVLIWKEIKEDKAEDIKLPEGLISITESAEKGIMSKAAKKVVTVSGNLPNSGKENMENISCMIDPDAVKNDEITINGITLRIKRTLLGSAPPFAVKEMNLYKDENDMNSNPPKPIGKDDKVSISINKQIILEIKVAALYDEYANQSYTIPIPAGIGKPTDTSSLPLTIYIDENNKSVPFGTLSWVEDDSNMTVKFIQVDVDTVDDDNKPIHMTLKDIKDVSMGFKCKLDKNSDNGNDKGEIKIDLPGTGTITITVPEFVPIDPKIEKKLKNNTINNDGTADWTIAYQHPVKAYTKTLPKTIVDTLPAELEVVAGSIVVTAKDKEDKVIASPGNGSAAYDAVANKITYTFPDSTNKLPGEAKVEITYKTKLSKDGLDNAWGNPKERQYTNTAEGLDDNGDSFNPALKASATLTVPNNWVGGKVFQKDGVKAINAAGEQVIKWTLKVKALSQSYNYLTVIDTMGKGLIFDSSTFEIKKDGTLDTSIAKPNPDTNNKITIPLVANNNPTTSGNEYIITYDTKVDTSYFDNNTALEDKDVTNKAQLLYSWFGTSGTGSDKFTPEIEKGPKDTGIFGALIKKEFVSHSYTDNSFIWKITVNPNNVNVTSGTIVDDLSGSDLAHRYIREGIEVTTARDTVDKAVRDAMGATSIDSDITAGTTVTLTDTELKIKLGTKGTDPTLASIGKESFSFLVTTYASDPKIWAGNSEREYVNKVVMPNTETTVDNKLLAKSSEDSDAKKITTNVLKKSNGVYDADTKKITWTLTVNENAVDLKDVVITDQLSTLLSCDPADAKLGGVDFDGTDNKFTVDSTGKITINLKEVSTTKTITYQTLVDVNAPEFKTSKTITITNQASITSGSNAEKNDSNNVSVTIENDVINKTVDKVPQNKDDIVVNYIVEINPLGMDLLGGQTGSLRIMDTLASGLYLDMDTVKIYSATRSKPTGSPYKVKLTKGNEIPNPEVTYDSGTNAFSLVIPDPKESYILEYSAYVVRAGVELKNNVELKGSILPENGVQEGDTAGFTMSVFMGARFSLPKKKFTSVQIQKVDGANVTLKGAGFGLYSEKDESKLLVEGICDATTGICTLAVPKSAATKLYWKETQAPPANLNGGVIYEKNDEWHEIDVAANNPSDVLTMVNLDTTDAAKGKIHIKKTDNVTNDALFGAIFQLFKYETCLEADKASEEVTVNSTTGEIIFDNLYPERTYWVKEVKAPNGYVLPAKPFPITAKVDAELTVTDIPNEKADVTLEVTKVDGEDTNVSVEDVEFSLYEDETCSKQFGTTQKTDENGICTFKNLQPNAIYYLKETKQATGYIKNDSIYTVPTGNTNNVTISLEKIANYKEGWDKKSSIQITKSDAEDGTKLKDVSFRLYADNKTTIIGEKKTDEKGVCTFENLVPNTVYHIKETKAADGYIVDDNFHEVTTGANKTSVSLALTNYKIGWNEKASIEITKTNKSGELKLENAVFELYAEDKTTLLDEQTTDIDGICTFAKLKEGTYYLKEKKAPAGYQLDGKWIEVTVRLNTKETTAIINYPEEKKRPGGGGDDGYDEDDTYNKFIKKDTKVSDGNNISSTIPKTGVEDNFLLYTIGLTISVIAVAIFGLVLVRRKRKK